MAPHRALRRPAPRGVDVTFGELLTSALLPRCLALPRPCALPRPSRAAQYSCTEQDVHALFSQFGKVETVHMKTGFAFVWMASGAEGAAACAQLDGSHHMGRTMKVDWAQGGKNKEHGGPGDGAGAGEGQGRGGRWEGRRQSGEGGEEGDEGDEGGDAQRMPTQQGAPQVRIGEPNKKLFCFGFRPGSITEEDLRGLVQDCGTITDAFVANQRAFGFVTFSTLEESAAALQKAGTTINGQVLQMKYHEDTEGPRGRGRGGRGGGRGGGRTSVHDRLGGRGGGGSYRQEQQYAEQQPAPPRRSAPPQGGYAEQQQGYERYPPQQAAPQQHAAPPQQQAHQPPPQYRAREAPPPAYESDPYRREDPYAYDRRPQQPQYAPPAYDRAPPAGGYDRGPPSASREPYPVQGYDAPRNPPPAADGYQGGYQHPPRDSYGAPPPRDAYGGAPPQRDDGHAPPPHPTDPYATRPPYQQRAPPPQYDDAGGDPYARRGPPPAGGDTYARQPAPASYGSEYDDPRYRRPPPEYAPPPRQYADGGAAPYDRDPYASQRGYAHPAPPAYDRRGPPPTEPASRGYDQQGAPPSQDRRFNPQATWDVYERDRGHERGEARGDGSGYAPEPRGGYRDSAPLQPPADGGYPQYGGPPPQTTSPPPRAYAEGDYPPQQPREPYAQSSDAARSSGGYVAAQGDGHEHQHQEQQQ